MATPTSGSAIADLSSLTPSPSTDQFLVYGTPTTLTVTRLGNGPDLGGGVPEPASWALMILGFGAAGAALRRRTVPPAHA